MSMLRHFFCDPLRAHDADLRGHLADSRPGSRLNVQFESCGKADGAEQAEFVLGEPLLGVAHGAEQVAGEILTAADKIDHAIGNRVEKETVDGEVAAGRILLGRTERDVIGMTAVAIRGVAAEGRNLDLAGAIRTLHEDHPEGRADGPRPPPAERGADLVGHGVGRHVIVFGRFAQQLVTDAASRPVGLETCGAERLDRFDGKSALLIRLEGFHGATGSCPPF